MPVSIDIKRKFDELYAEWSAAIRRPPLAFSSRPRDFTELEPYRRMVALGKDALPLVLEKLEQGVFFMNEAALKLGNCRLEELVESEKAKPVASRMAEFAEAPPKFLSEQQKARLVLGHLRH